MCDDLGWGDTGFNGNRIIQTPNLDQLAAKGMIFRRFYSASPVCSPTRGSCLTGRNPYRYGIYTANAGHMKPEEITLPELLKENGYVTGHFGKWHLGTLTTLIQDANRGTPGDSTHFSLPSMHGFDEFFSTESKVPTWDPMISPAEFDTINGESLRYGWKAIESGMKTNEYGTHYWKGMEMQETDRLTGNDSEIILDRALRFMENAVSANNPFLSVIWFHTPHLPVVADRINRDKYREFPLQEQIYYGTISAMDEQVGRLWEKLGSWGIQENTMIWFCSDNGPEDRTPGSSGPFRERKRSLYEGGIRVPAFCLWPGKIKGGTQTDFPAVTSDYLPTVLDITGIEYPDNRLIDGISLKEVVSGLKSVREKPIGFRYPGKMSWMTNQYKLISKDNGKTFELYDLLGDMEEKSEISGENPELVDSLKLQLAEWLKSCMMSEYGRDY